MNRFIPTLLRIALSSLHVAVAYPADALGDTQGIAVVSAIATVPPRRTLDLRPPDLRSLHVQNLQQVVTSADSDEVQAVTVAAASFLPEERPDTHPSLGGVASLYWAARHPTQAWRVFLPIQLDGYDADTDNRGRAAESATPETLTEQREISAKPAPITLAHDTGGKCVRRMLALAAGCTTMGTGFGSTTSGAHPVTFSWKSSDPVSGTMSATLPDGETYTGQFFEITQNTRVDNLGPLWTGWRPGWGFDYWDAGPSFVTHYSGRVVTNLGTPGGAHMHCKFELARPSEGMAGGGRGQCQMPDGKTIDASFPTA